MLNLTMRTNFDGNNNSNNTSKNNGLNAIKIKGLQNKKIDNEWDWFDKVVNKTGERHVIYI